MYRILAIDGGGMRGIIPAKILTHIEAKTGKKIAEMFDLIVGTSTGGLIAAAAVTKNKQGKPKFTAKEILNIYTKHGAEIFEKSFLREATSVKGAFEERYDHDALEKILGEYLGNATLKDCFKDIVMPSYDIELREPYFFKTRRAKESPDRNHYLRDAVRATSAAPTYFEPAPVWSLQDPEPTRRVLVDGGVFVNNPAMCALAEAISLKNELDDILLLSLGTGGLDEKIAYKEAKNWGYASWARPLIDVMMDGNADATDYHLNQLLPGLDKPDKQRYFRFDIAFGKNGPDKLDNASKGNIEKLKAKAEEIIQNHEEEFERLLKHLKSSQDNSPQAG